MAEFRTCDVAIVDDDAAVLESFRFMLELAGLRVATFASASAYLRQDELGQDGPRPRCLILDQNMPVMTGLELAASLRGSGNDIPVLIITSSPSPAMFARAAEIGIVRVLEKPPTEDDLIGFVKAAS